MTLFYFCNIIIGSSIICSRSFKCSSIFQDKNNLAKSEFIRTDVEEGIAEQIAEWIKCT